MKYNIAICDDEEKDIQYLTSVVKNWACKEKVSVDVAAFPSAESFLFQYAERKDFQILLLDVEMKGMSGIDLAKHIRQDNSQAEIIFITSHFELSGEGYEVDALHYLVKPIDEGKLKTVLTKAVQKIAAMPPSLIINCEGEMLRLYEKDIFYIEAFLHYIVIHTRDREYKFKENISDFARKLSEDFYQPHRSYLVSLKQIVRISRSSICLDNGVELPLARGKYDDINRAYIERN